MALRSLPNPKNLPTSHNPGRPSTLARRLHGCDPTCVEFACLFYDCKPEKEITMSTASPGTLMTSSTHKISRVELSQIPTPQATATHQPLSHYQIVEALIESLSFRH